MFLSVVVSSFEHTLIFHFICTNIFCCYIEIKCIYNNSYLLKSSYIFFSFQVLTFEDSHSENEESSLTHLDHGFHSKLPPGILPHGLPTVKEVAPAITPQEEKKEEKKQSKFYSDKFWRFDELMPAFLIFLVVELSEEQKQMIVLSEDFQRFVLKAGRVIERALWEQNDIYTDYIGGYDTDEAM